MPAYLSEKSRENAIFPVFNKHEKKSCVQLDYENFPTHSEYFSNLLFNKMKDIV